MGFTDERTFISFLIQLTIVVMPPFFYLLVTYFAVVLPALLGFTHSGDSFGTFCATFGLFPSHLFCLF
jgi:hypothetical protein